MNSSSVKTNLNDSFTSGLKQRLPTDIYDSFSNEQMAALKIAFGARTWGKHRIDFRGTVKLWTWRYYFVFLMGRNKRSLSRREQRIALMIKTGLIALFLTFSTLMGVLVLYLIKSAMGIDIFPGFSFGVWGWFKGAFL